MRFASHFGPLRWLLLLLFAAAWPVAPLHAQQAAAPVFVPSSAYGVTPFSVQVTCSTAGASLYYTLDGTAPTNASTPIASGATVGIGCNLTLKAIAYAAGLSPSPVTTATYNVTGKVAGGSDFSGALAANGLLWTWGVKDDGRLGDGLKFTSGSLPVPLNPVQTTSGSSTQDLQHLIDFALSYILGLAVDSSNAVWAWGDNTYGELGNGATTQVHLSSAQRVVKSTNPTDYLTGMNAVAAGQAHGLALEINDGSSHLGRVYAWGERNFGRLGDGYTSSTGAVRPYAGAVGTSVTTQLQNAFDISAGQEFSLAISGTNPSPGGQVYAWGSNTWGQLGQGGATPTTLGFATAVKLNSSGALLNDAIEVAAGWIHSVALRADGTVWCWGCEGSGACGDGQFGNTVAPYPTRVTKVASGGVLQNIVQVAAGAYFSAALDSSGHIWTWGANGDGNLGHGGTTRSIYADQVTQWPGGITPKIVSIGIGGYYDAASNTGHGFMLALGDDGTLYGWGYNAQSEIGTNSVVTPQLTPQKTVFTTPPEFGNKPPGLNPTVTQTTPPGAAVSITFDAGLSDPDGVTTTSHVLQFVVTSSTTGATVYAPAPSHATSVAWSSVPPDSYTLAVTATDGCGASTTVARPFSVPDRPPTLNLSIGGTLVGPTSVTIYSGLADPDGVTATSHTLVYTVADSNHTTQFTTTTHAASAVWSPAPTGNNYTVTVQATDPQGLTATASTTLSIASPSIVLTPVTASAYEGTTPAQITFTRTCGLPSAAPDLAVSYSVTGTAQNGFDLGNADGSALGGVISIPAGQASATLSVYAIPDGTVRAGESALITVIPNNGYIPNGAATVNRVALPLLTVAATAPNAYEPLTSGAAGWNGSFRISRAGDLTSSLTVTLTRSGTAPTGASTALPTSMTIPAGLAYYDLPVVPVYQTGSDPGGTVVLSITPSPSTFQLPPAGASATVAITPRTALPLVTIVATVPNASEAGPVPGAFTVSRTGNLAVPLTVPLSTPNTPSDVLALPTSIVIPAGAASATIPVTPFDDGVVQSSGNTVSVSISPNPQVYTVGSAGTATVTVADNDPSPGAPTLSPAGGTFAALAPVTVNCSTPGAVLHYTLTGQTPTETDPTIAAGQTLLMTATRNLSVRAFYAGDKPSNTVSALFTMTGAVSVSDHSLYLAPGGTLSAAGMNAYGEVGNGTSGASQSTFQPVLQSAGVPLNGVIAIAAGSYHSVALTSDGRLWTWGYNEDGELGNGTNASNPYAASVTVPGETFTQVAAGYYHTVALAADKTVWCFGGNSYGELGAGSTGASSVPVQVQVSGGAPLGNVVAVAAGNEYSLALDANGNVWSWGYNGQSVLGDGTTTSHALASPVLASGTPGDYLSGVEAIAAGSSSALAIKSVDGSVWAWGTSYNGLLGAGASSAVSAYPSSVLIGAGIPLLRIHAASASLSNAIAWDAAGDCWVWGLNSDGELGLATTPDTAYATPGPLANVAGAGTGYYCAMAVCLDASLYGWGYNVNFEVGLPSSGRYYEPALVQAGPDANHNGISDWREATLSVDPTKPFTQGLPNFLATSTAVSTRSSPPSGGPAPQLPPSSGALDIRLLCPPLN